MAEAEAFSRSKSKSLQALLSLDRDCNHGVEISSAGVADSVHGDENIVEPLRLPIKLVKNLGEKLKRTSCRSIEESIVDLRRPLSGCHYIKSDGCKVSACDDFDFSSVPRRSNIVEDCALHKLISIGGLSSELDCCSYSVADRIHKKTSRKCKEIKQCSIDPDAGFSLPDDVVELILVRLPLTALISARHVCKKWRTLTSTLHFMQMRHEVSSNSPWLFLFGIAWGGHHKGEMRTLDASADRWYIINGNNALKGRFSYSVAGVGNDIYIVGGCSLLSETEEEIERSYMKRHKGVLVFSPITGKWHKAAPMKTARMLPLLGVFEASPNCSIFHNRHEQPQRQWIRPKFRLGGSSDVYEDPHRFSLRRQTRDDIQGKFLEENDEKVAGSRRTENSGQTKLALIVVGGNVIDEPFHTGEAYDPTTDRWVEIAALPAEFGTIRSGAVCSGKFYVYSEADKLASFDLQRGIWVIIQTTQPPIRLRDYRPNLVSCKNRLFLICVSWCDRARQANDRGKVVRKMWELDLGFRNWKEVSVHPDAPMDCNAVFVADNDKIYGVEMFKVLGQVLNFLTVCDVSYADLRWRRMSNMHPAQDTDARLSKAKTFAVLQL